MICEPQRLLSGLLDSDSLQGLVAPLYEKYKLENRKPEFAKEIREQHRKGKSKPVFVELSRELMLLDETDAEKSRKCSISRSMMTNIKNGKVFPDSEVYLSIVDAYDWHEISELTDDNAGFIAAISHIRQTEFKLAGPPIFQEELEALRYVFGNFEQWIEAQLQYELLAGSATLPNLSSEILTAVHRKTGKPYRIIKLSDLNDVLETWQEAFLLCFAALRGEA